MPIETKKLVLPSLTPPPINKLKSPVNNFPKVLDNYSDSGNSPNQPEIIKNSYKGDKSENNLELKNNYFEELPDLLTDGSEISLIENKIMGDLSFGSEKGSSIISGNIIMREVNNIPKSESLNNSEAGKDHIMKKFLSEIENNKIEDSEGIQSKEIKDNIINITGIKSKHISNNNSMSEGNEEISENSSGPWLEQDQTGSESSTGTYQIAQDSLDNQARSNDTLLSLIIHSCLKNKTLLVLIIIAIMFIKMLPIAIILPMYLLISSYLVLSISYEKPYVYKVKAKSYIRRKYRWHVNKIKKSSMTEDKRVKVVESRIGVTNKISLPVAIYNQFDRGRQVSKAELDTGAAVNCLSLDMATKLCGDINRLRDTTEYNLQDVNNNPIRVIAAKVLKANIQGYGDFYLPVHIIESENIFILGKQFMLKHQLMMEIRGRKVIISLKTGFIKNPRLVNIDKVCIKPGEKIKSAFKSQGMNTNSAFCLYRSNIRDIMLEYKVYKNKNGKFFTVIVRNTGDIPLCLNPGELIASAIPISLTKKQYADPHIVENLNKDKVFINFCSSHSHSRTIIKSKPSNKKKTVKEKRVFLNLTERLNFIYRHKICNLNKIVGILLNNEIWLLNLKKIILYRVNKIILYINLYVNKLIIIVNKKLKKNYSSDKVMINVVSGESKKDHMTQNIEDKEQDNFDEITISKLKDRMTEGQEGISINAPLPHPKLDLEQILEKVHYIKNVPVRDKVAQLLLKYNNGASHTYDVGRSINKMDFPLPDKIPQNSKIYNLNMTDQMHLFHFVRLCEEQGILEPAPSHLQFGSPCFMTSRKNGQESPRIVIDARAINQNINYNSSSITLDPISTLSNILPYVKYSSFVDVKNAFYNLELSDKIIESGITNIVTSFGVFRFRRALTGYAGTPALLLSYILSNIHLNDENILDVIQLLVVFFDDLSLFSFKGESIDEHLSKLDKFLSRMSRLNLKLNLDKCRFCVNLEEETIIVLGYEIGRGQIKIPNKKIEHILQLESPKNLKDLQSLLGNLTYFRPMLTLNIHRCINNLYRQVRNFDWDDEAERDFQAIKEFLKQDNCKIDENVGHDVQFLYCDASERAMGGALIGLKVADLLPQTYPETSIIKREIFRKYFNNENVGVLFQEKDYLKLYYEISKFLKINKYFDDFKTWKMKFLILSMTNIDLKGYLNLHFENTSDILDIFEIRERYLNFCNSLYDKDLVLDSPEIFTYLSIIFSRYTKHKLKIYYLSLDGKKVYSTSIYDVVPGTANSEINIIFADNCYQYLIFKEDIMIENLKLPKTCRAIDLLDRALFTLIERALRMTPSQMKGRMSILGYFSKAVGESVMKTSAIVYLELLAIFESLQYFETQIANNKTLVLTDNVTAMKILNNKKIEAKKSKLDILSQRVLLWYGNSISFLSVSTKEQVADFISRLLPERKENFNFADPLKPLYEGSLFKIFEPTPLKRNKETFIKNLVAIKKERVNYIDSLKIKVITRGRTDALMEEWDKINKKKNIVKKKVKNKFDSKTSRKTQNSIRDIPLSVESQKDKDDVPPSQGNKDSHSKIDKSKSSSNNEIINMLEDTPNEYNINHDTIVNNPSQEEENEDLEYLAPPNGPIVFNNFIPSIKDDKESESSLFHSENQPGLNRNIEHIDRRLNRKRTDSEFDKMQGNLLETFLEELEDRDNIPLIPVKENKSQNSDYVLKTSQNNFLPNSHETDKIFNKYVFIHMQIREGITNDINPLTMKYFKGKIILPEILYSLIAAVMHGGLVHCGAEKLYNNINQLYYLKNKMTMMKVIKGIVKCCLTCYKAKPTGFPLIKGSSIHAGNFFRNRVVALDLLEFPKVLKGEQSLDGIQAILVFMDISTQYITTHLLRKTDGRAIRHGIAQYLTIHGLVKFFWPDNAANIRSNETKKFLNSVGARFMDSAPYRSASRGNMENRIRIVQNVIRICSIHKNSIRIMTSLAFSIFVINTTRLLNSPLSPFNLHFLSLYNFAGDITTDDKLFESKFSFNIKSLEERMGDKKETFLDLYNKTKNIILKRQERITERLNKNRRPHNFQLNDLVLLRNDAKKQEKFHKNRPLYDLFVWKVVKVRKYLVDIENLITNELHIASVQQVKKIDQEGVGLYKLPKDVASYFKLLTIKDLDFYNNMLDKNLLEQEENMKNIEKDPKLLESLTSESNITDKMTDIQTEIVSQF